VIRRDRPPKPEKAEPRPGPSVYEGRESGLAARLRRLLGPRPPSTPRIAVGDQGQLTYVTEGGRVVGVLDEAGGVVRFPPCCDDPARCEREECWTTIADGRAWGAPRSSERQR
jgi:hypothetical protein